MNHKFMVIRVVLAIAVLLALFTVGSDACTSVMVGPEATSDGSAWVGQSDDAEGDGDSRLVKVPPMDWPPGALRPIINYQGYPRYVGTERKIPAYYPSPLLPNGTQYVIGSIPQVPHTHGYFEGDYAISNDQGLAFGESTTSARTYALNKPQGPSLLSMYELSRIAAERASSSREAVLLIGGLACTYGFYGDSAASTGGESLLIADSNEQWIFHVLAESAATGGAIWGAYRIPRDHAAIVANAFVIGFMNVTDTDNFLFSFNMHSVAVANGWWDGQGELHFTRTFSGGEYTSQFYSGRRMWAFWRELAPSLSIPSNYSSYLEAVGTTYPISAKPDTLVTSSDILSRVYRNYYQGTEFDLSIGPAAGPFNTPFRVKEGAGEAKLLGCDDQCSRWERPIASFRTTSIHQCQLFPQDSVEHKQGPLVWFLPGAALSGVFVPMYTSMDQVPAAIGTGSNIVFDRSTAYWIFREMAQWMYPKWGLVGEAILSTAASLEAGSAAALASDMKSGGLNAHAVCEERVRVMTQKWEELYGRLLIRYSDFWDYSIGNSKPLGYPEWWLTEVGYASKGPKACYPVCP